jgi:uncharacterized protein YceK
MLTQSRITTVAFVLFLLTAGCASVVNIADTRNLGHVYGGVLIDSSLIASDAKAIVEPASYAKEAHEIPFGLGFAAIPDLPLSAVVDTLTLPITVPGLIIRLLTQESSAPQLPPGKKGLVGQPSE